MRLLASRVEVCYSYCFGYAKIRAKISWEYLGGYLL